MSGKKKILLVEDEKNIRTVLRMYFKKEGYSVIETGSGIDAILLAEEEKPDIMILDNMLPGISGIDVCRKLKSSEDTKNIIIVMLSADPRLSDLPEEYKAGPDLFEKKPFSLKRLMQNVKQFTEPVRIST